MPILINKFGFYIKGLNIIVIFNLEPLSPLNSFRIL
jgi:hypothetical protein